MFGWTDGWIDGCLEFNERKTKLLTVPDLEKTSWPFGFLHLHSTIVKNIKVHIYISEKSRDKVVGYEFMMANLVCYLKALISSVRSWNNNLLNNLYTGSTCRDLLEQIVIIVNVI